MKALTNNWLRAGLTLMILVFGVFFIVKAVDKKEKPVNDPVMETWYFNGATNPANDDELDASQYSLEDSEPCGGLIETVCMIEAPASDNHPDQPDLLYEVSPTKGTASDQIQEALNSEVINETVQSFRSR